MQILIQPDRDEDALYVAFGNDALARGRVVESKRVTEDITLDFGPGGTLVGLDILNASSVLAADYSDIRMECLVGVKEAADLVGVHRSNFLRDFANNPDFPRPVRELGSGRLWLRDQVEEYVAKIKARPAGSRRHTPRPITH
jgi:uncharacterized protein YuzE/predicted DNA-binding transcriptional regulator AlpA